MTVTLTIRCDNEAFGETNADHGVEVARILNACAEQLQGDFDEGAFKLYDGNGNSVGRCVIDCHEGGAI